MIILKITILISLVELSLYNPISIPYEFIDGIKIKMSFLNNSYIYFDVDLESVFTWTQTLDINMGKLKNYIYNTIFKIFYRNSSLDSVEFRSNAYLYDINNLTIPIKNLRYSIVYNSKMNHKQSSMAFGFNIENKNHSITEVLYQENKISKNEFSIFPNKNRSRFGILYLGELNGNIISNNSYKRTLKVINNNSNLWFVNISKMTIGENIATMKTFYVINKNGFFSSTSPYLKLPRYEFDFILYAIFKKYIEKEICFLVIEKFIECLAEGFNENEIENVNIKIDGEVFSLNLMDYATKSGKIIFFDYIIINTDSKNWVLGTQFLLNYNVTFSYDSQTITLYSSIPLLLPSKIICNYNLIFKSLCISNIIISIFSILLNIQNINLINNINK